MKKFSYYFMFFIASISISCSKHEEFDTNQSEISKQSSLTDKSYNTKESEFYEKNLVQTSALLRGWSEKRNCLRGSGICALAVIEGNYSGQENIIPITLELISSNQLGHDKKVVENLS